MARLWRLPRLRVLELVPGLLFHLLGAHQGLGLWVRVYLWLPWQARGYGKEAIGEEIWEKAGVVEWEVCRMLVLLLGLMLICLAWRCDRLDDLALQDTRLYTSRDILLPFSIRDLKRVDCLRKRLAVSKPHC